MQLYNVANRLMSVQELLASAKSLLGMEDPPVFRYADFVRRIDLLQFALSLDNRRFVDLESRQPIGIDDFRSMIGDNIHLILEHNKGLNSQSEPLFYAGAVKRRAHVVAIGLGDNRFGFKLDINQGCPRVFRVLQRRLSPGVWSTLSFIEKDDWKGMNKFISFGEALVRRSRPS